MSDLGSNNITDLQPGQNQTTLINGIVEDFAYAAGFGRNTYLTTGRTIHWYGIRWGGNLIAAGSTTLSASNTHYGVVDVATGVLSWSTSDANWNNRAQYRRALLATTDASVITSCQDHRFGPGGALGGPIRQASIPVQDEPNATTNLAAAHAGVYRRCTFNGAKTYTVRNNATHAVWAESSFPIANRSPGGDLTLVEDTSVTINPPAGGTLVLAPGMSATLQWVATDIYDLIGQTVPL